MVLLKDFLFLALVAEKNPRAILIEGIMGNILTLINERLSHILKILYLLYANIKA